MIKKQPLCPNGCKGKWVKGSRTAAGSERRTCKDCGKTWTVDPKIPKRPALRDVNCPRCQGNHIHRKGGNRMVCKNCGKWFQKKGARK